MNEINLNLGEMGEWSKEDYLKLSDDLYSNPISEKEFDELYESIINPPEDILFSEIEFFEL